MDTRVTKLLGIKHPIIQGAMARIADGRLAGAVSAVAGWGSSRAAGQVSPGLKNRCALPVP